MTAGSWPHERIPYASPDRRAAVSGRVPDRGHSDKWHDPAVRVGGQGPAVILLHGYGETGDMWASWPRTLPTTTPLSPPTCAAWGSPFVLPVDTTRRHRARMSLAFRALRDFLPRSDPRQRCVHQGEPGYPGPGTGRRDAYPTILPMSWVTRSTRSIPIASIRGPEVLRRGRARTKTRSRSGRDRCARVHRTGALHIRAAEAEMPRGPRPARARPAKLHNVHQLHERERLPACRRSSLERPAFEIKSREFPNLPAILIQPAGWAEASRRWQSRIRKTCAIG